MITIFCQLLSYQCVCGESEVVQVTFCFSIQDEGIKLKQCQGVNRVFLMSCIMFLDRETVLAEKDAAGTLLPAKS